MRVFWAHYPAKQTFYTHFLLSILFVQPRCRKESILQVRVETLGISYLLLNDRIIRPLQQKSMDLGAILAIAFQLLKEWTTNILSLDVANIFLLPCLRQTTSFLYPKVGRFSTSKICNCCAGNVIGRRPLKTTCQRYSLQIPDRTLLFL